MTTLEMVAIVLSAWMFVICICMYYWHRTITNAKIIDAQTFHLPPSRGELYTGKRLNSVVINKPIRGFKNPVWACAQWFQAVQMEVDFASVIHHAQDREHVAVSLEGDRDVHDLLERCELICWFNANGQVQIGTSEELNHGRA